MRFLVHTANGRKNPISLYQVLAPMVYYTYPLSQLACSRASENVRLTRHKFFIYLFEGVRTQQVSLTHLTIQSCIYLPPNPFFETIDELYQVVNASCA